MKIVTIFQQVNPDYMRTIRGEAMPVTDMKKVASFQTDLPVDDALEQAFRLTNHIDRPWEENPGITAEPGPHASTSVGDVVVVDGEAYQCARMGWTKLEEFTP